MQVVHALVEADKNFDLLVIPGAGHGPGGAYGSRLRNDFFVRHLLGVAPPDWNSGIALADEQDRTGGFELSDDEMPPSFFDYSDDFRWWASDR
jgi:hypothetical protein